MRICYLFVGIELVCSECTIPDFFDGWVVGDGEYIRVTPLAVLATVPAGILCFLGMQKFSRIVVAGAVLNVATLVLFSVSGLFYVSFEQIKKGFKESVDANDIIDATLTGVFAFIGIEVVTVLASEAVSPEKDIPFSMSTSIFVVILLYCVVGLVAAGLTTPEDLNVEGLNGSASVTTIVTLWSQGDRPIALGAVLGLMAAACLFILVLCSMTNFSRIMYAMSCDGLLFPRFKILTKKHVPKYAIVLCTVVSSILGVVFAIQSLLKLVIPTALLGYCLTCVGLITNRMQFPLDIQNFKKGGFHANYFVIPGTLIWFVVGCLVYFSVFFRDAVVPEYRTFAMVLSGVILVGCPGMIVVLLYFKNRHEYRELATSFKMPFFPFLPLLCITVNTLLLANVPIQHFAVVLIWSFVGLLLYFTYGIRSSRLNFTRAEYNLGTRDTYASRNNQRSSFSRRMERVYHEGRLSVEKVVRVKDPGSPSTQTSSKTITSRCASSVSSSQRTSVDRNEKGRRKSASHAQERNDSNAPGKRRASLSSFDSVSTLPRRSSRLRIASGTDGRGEVFQTTKMRIVTEDGEAAGRNHN